MNDATKQAFDAAYPIDPRLLKMEKRQAALQAEAEALVAEVQSSCSHEAVWEADFEGGHRPVRRCARCLLEEEAWSTVGNYSILGGNRVVLPLPSQDIFYKERRRIQPLVRLHGPHLEKTYPHRKRKPHD